MSASTRLAAIVLLGAALIFALVSWRDPGYARLRLAGATSGTAVHRDAATFVVEAAPFSLIELSVDGRRVASAYVPWNAHEVRFEGTPLDDGRNAVVARTTLWYAAAPRAHTAALVVNNVPPVVTGPAHRTNAPPFPGAWPGRNGRSLALQVRQREVSVAFAAELSRNDRAIAGLRAGRIDVSAFVDDVFGGARFNRKPIAGFFIGVRPTLYAEGDAVTVSADSGYQRMGLEDLPAFAGDVEITNAFTGPRIDVAGDGPAERYTAARRWAYDALRVDVNDYRVVPHALLPARTRGTTYVWERPFGDVRAHVALSLAFAPFSSFDGLRRGLDLPVFAFAPHVVARFLAFLHGFMLALPMFAYLVLSRGRNPRFATIARRLIAVAVASDVFDACISAQPDVDGEILLVVPALRALPSSLVNLVLVPAVIGLVLALLAWSLARVAAHARSLIGTVVFDAAHAVRVAALAFAAIVVAGYAAGMIAHVPSAYPPLVGAALAAALIGILVSLDWWAIPGRGFPRTAFTLATVAFAIAVAVPFALAPYGVWATVPERAGTAFADPLSPLPLAASFLRSLAPLCPLAFGLLLIAGVRPDPAALGVDRARFARLVLCCYAVLPGMVVLVPIGFVLAWCTYAWVNVRDAGAASSLDPLAVPTPRERGLRVIPYALACVVVEALVLLPSEVRHLAVLHTPFIALEAAGFVAVIAASLVMPAFAFAACNDELAGAPGPRKAFNVACWAIACSLPAWFLRWDGLVSAAAIVLVTAALYTGLGRLAPASERNWPTRIPRLRLGRLATAKLPQRLP